MYDIKRIEYYIKHPEELKLSKWLLYNLDCTLEGRKRCGGKCCKGHTNNETKGQTHVQYMEDELKHLPVSFKEHIIDGVVQNRNGVCELIELCLKYPQHKPIECKLAPLTITNGRLVIQYATIHPKAGCPNFKKGNYVYITMKDNLIDIFGQEFYDRLVKEL